MSRRKREAIAAAANAESQSAATTGATVTVTEKAAAAPSMFKFLQKKQVLIAGGICLLFAFAVVGAIASRSNGNLFASQSAAAPEQPNSSSALPTTSPTPRLSKEYIYAGSRTLAVQEAGTENRPPSDLAVWRPSNGTWYVLTGDGQTQQMMVQQWGTEHDEVAPGDYDGDSKTDFCVFRPSTGFWYALRSTDNTLIALQFGGNGDKPVQADYDGDGRTDMAVYRTGDAKWYVWQSASNSMAAPVSFAVTGNYWVPADYDGDGLADFAQYTQLTGLFHVKKSSDGTTFQKDIGRTGGKPVVGDYDGDGKYDYATWDSSNVWRIKHNNQNETVRLETWGVYSTDVPVQGDYDGDGRTDVASWRSSGAEVGKWLIKKSQDNSTRTEMWGTTLDIPVPAPYKR